MVSVIILTVISFFLFKIKIRFKDIVFPAIIFFSSFLPLLIFDFRHNHQLVNKLLNLFSQSTTASHTNLQIVNYLSLLFRTYGRFLFPTGPADINIQILPCKKYLEIINSNTSPVFILFGLTFLAVFITQAFFKKRSTFGQKMVSVHLIIILSGLSIYSFLNPGHLYGWFFVVLTPAFSFITAYFLNNIENIKFGKLTVKLVLLLIIFINLVKFLQITASIGYKDKISAVKYAISEVGKKEFNLEMVGNGCNGYGYRYLFTYLGKEPIKSYMDYQYEDWLYSKSPKENPDYNVILVPLTDLDSQNLQMQYKEYKEKSFKSMKFNNLEVLLTDF